MLNETCSILQLHESRRIFPKDLPRNADSYPGTAYLVSRKIDHVNRKFNIYDNLTKNVILDRSSSDSTINN